MRFKSPISAHIELTYWCTEKCTFCYNHGRHGYIPCVTNPSENKILSGEKLVDVIRILGDNGVFNVTITGGEPLSRRDVIPAMLSKGQEYNMVFGLNTNATLLSKEDIDIFNKYGLKSILVSLHSSSPVINDSITQTPGSWEDTNQSLELLVREGFNPSVNMVVIKENIDDVYGLGMFLNKRYGIKSFSATPNSPTTKTQQDGALNISEVKHVLDQLLNLSSDFGMNVDVLEVLPYCAIYEDKYKRFMNRGCSAARTNIAVTPSGNVKPCTHEYRSYGNILNDDFSKIWKSMSDWLTASENAECSGCGEYSGCGGACRTLAELFNGSLDKNSPYMSHSVSKLLPRKSKVLERDATYTLVDAIRFRKENSAQYLIVGGNKAIIGNEELKNFMTLLLKKDSFTAEQLGREMNVSIEPVIGIMQYLYANSLIKLDGGKNGRHTRK